MNLKKKINKYAVWIILISILLVIITIVKTPVFFDNFGIIVFAYLTYLGFYLSKRNLPDWISLSLVGIGVVGLIVDGINILKGGV